MAWDCVTLAAIWIKLCLLLGTSQAKQCYHMRVSGVEKWTEYNGIYDLSPDQKCNGKNVYIQNTTINRNYIFYYKPDTFKYGWLIGPEVCIDRGYVYGWNNHKRPDYMLRNWMERTTSYGWSYNSDIVVRCTEGLTYGAIVGIIVACAFGIPIIIISIVYIVKTIKNKTKDGSGSRNQSRTQQPERPMATTNTAFSDNNNSAQENAQINQSLGPESDLPSYSLSPPQYEEIERSDWSNTEANVNTPQPIISPSDVTDPSTHAPSSVAPPTYDNHAVPQNNDSSVLPLTPPSYAEAIAANPNAETAEAML